MNDLALTEDIMPEPLQAEIARFQDAVKACVLYQVPDYDIADQARRWSEKIRSAQVMTRDNTRSASVWLVKLFKVLPPRHGEDISDLTEATLAICGDFPASIWTPASLFEFIAVLKWPPTPAEIKEFMERRALRATRTLRALEAIATRPGWRIPPTPYDPGPAFTLPQRVRHDRTDGVDDSFDDSPRRGSLGAAVSRVMNGAAGSD